jgi:hypothetical protein
MKDLQIEERAVRAVDLNVADVGADGPVDVALCALALSERARQQDVVIVTDEQRHASKWRQRSDSRVMTLLQVLEEIRADR